MIRNVQKLKSLQNIFPLHDEISYCFAYGSAVFDQSIQNGNTVNNTPSPPLPSSKSRMVDLVLAVDDPIRWHRANMSKNWSHYSGLRYFGPKNVANIQRKFAAKIYYNTLVPIESDLFIKYGIISTEDFLNDLLDWETLYLSGRLHKPILVLHENIKSNDEQDFSVRNLYNAIELNRHSALHAALLLLPEKFTEKQLYMTIANLSYSGDFRMWFGEDRSKVEKIVWPQMERFRDLYGNFLAFVSLLPFAIIIAFFTLTIFVRDIHVILFFIGQLINEAINYLLKNHVQADRPANKFRDQFTSSGSSSSSSYGWPSSHCQFMAFFVTYSSFCVCFRLSRLKPYWFCFMLICIDLISFAFVFHSRTYLLYHHVHQCIHGAMIGTIMAIIWYALVQFIFEPIIHHYVMNSSINQFFGLCSIYLPLDDGQQKHYKYR
ncbi:phosphatidate cytidylyltransferase, mitochondrial [Dermatophagoides farinae]|uniref:phosphatidate cytidylyltransferase, mitochondrial n=1 Tax=Dermatophagoides farinae TaxID=6954 RepID=UPI003F62F2E9